MVVDFMLKTSLLLSVVGVIVLFFISENIEVTETSELNFDELGKEVKVKGRVVNLIDLEKTAIIELLLFDSDNTIPILVFKESSFDIVEGDLLSVVGEVAEYRDELEVIAYKINRLKSG